MKVMGGRGGNNSIFEDIVFTVLRIPLHLIIGVMSIFEFISSMFSSSNNVKSMQERKVARGDVEKGLGKEIEHVAQVKKQQQVEIKEGKQEVEENKGNVQKAKKPLFNSVEIGGMGFEKVKQPITEENFKKSCENFQKLLTKFPDSREFILEAVGEKTDGIFSSAKNFQEIKDYISNDETFSEYKLGRAIEVTQRKVEEKKKNLSSRIEQLENRYRDTCEKNFGKEIVEHALNKVGSLYNYSPSNPEKIESRYTIEQEWRNEITRVCEEEKALKDKEINQEQVLVKKEEIETESEAPEIQTGPALKECIPTKAKDYAYGFKYFEDIANTRLSDGKNSKQNRFVNDLDIILKSFRYVNEHHSNKDVILSKALQYSGIIVKNKIEISEAEEILRKNVNINNSEKIRKLLISNLNKAIERAFSDKEIYLDPQIDKIAQISSSMNLQENEKSGNEFHDNLYSVTKVFMSISCSYEEETALEIIHNALLASKCLVKTKAKLADFLDISKLRGIGINLSNSSEKKEQIFNNIRSSLEAKFKKLMLKELIKNNSFFSERVLEDYFQNIEDMSAYKEKLLSYKSELTKLNYEENETNPFEKIVERLESIIASFKIEIAQSIISKALNSCGYNVGESPIQMDEDGINEKALIGLIKVKKREDEDENAFFSTIKQQLFAKLNPEVERPIFSEIRSIEVAG